MKDKYIGQWCVFILLSLLLVGRFFLNDEHSRWVQYIGYMGVIIALADLYGNVYRKNHKEDKFRVIMGLAVVVAVVLMGIVVAMILDFIVLGNKENDLLTILALLISLPNDLYCKWISKYVKG